jgi:hypothetical protein
MFFILLEFHNIHCRTKTYKFVVYRIYKMSIAALLAGVNILAGLSFGYNTGVIAGALDLISTTGTKWGKDYSFFPLFSFSLFISPPSLSFSPFLGHRIAGAWIINDIPPSLPPFLPLLLFSPSILALFLFHWLRMGKDYFFSSLSFSSISFSNSLPCLSLFFLYLFISFYIFFYLFLSFCLFLSFLSFSVFFCLFFLFFLFLSFFLFLFLFSSF